MSDWTKDDRPLPEYFPPTKEGLQLFLECCADYLDGTYSWGAAVASGASQILLIHAFQSFHFPLYE